MAGETALFVEETEMRCVGKGGERVFVRHRAARPPVDGEFPVFTGIDTVAFGAYTR